CGGVVWGVFSGGGAVGGRGQLQPRPGQAEGEEHEDGRSQRLAASLRPRFEKADARSGVRMPARTGSNMNSIAPSSSVSRRALLSTLALLPALSAPLVSISALAQTASAGNLLPSWNDGPAKQAILDFVRVTTDRSSPSYVSAEDRIAVFDQDGTLWVEHPMYTQVIYCLERVPAVVAKRPEL